MSARLKPFLFIFAATLIVALILGPPMAFASKLPKECNIFHNKKPVKLGTCGHNVTFSKDKFDAHDMASSDGLESGSDKIPLIVQSSHPPLFLSPALLSDFAPLRC
jgi:hypothetical protein